MHVCSHVDRNGKSCPNLAPCEKHSRKGSWSKDRDHAQQYRERRDTLRRDHFTCRRCGRVDITGKSLDAHHVTPTELVTLCNDCHCAVDPNARRRKP